MDDQMVTAARYAVAEALAQVRPPTLRPATVVSATAASGNCTVLIDGDVTPVPAQSLVPIPTTGARVMLLLVAPSGAFIVGYVGGTPVPDIPLPTGKGSVQTAVLTTSSGTYVDGGGGMEDCTLRTGAKVAVHFYSQCTGTGGCDSIIAIAVSGATTHAAVDAECFYAAPNTPYCGGTVVLSGLTPGVNTFKPWFRVSLGTGSWIRCRMVVQPIS